MHEEKNGEEIGGWLILLAIGIVAAPVRTVVTMIKTYPEIFSTGTWQDLITQSSYVYNPFLASLIVVEILMKGILVVVGLYIAYKFFTRARDFPRWYIGLAILGLFFLLSDAFAMKIIYPSYPAFDSGTAKELLRSVITLVVLVPYMLVSKRVKATFVM